MTATSTGSTPIISPATSQSQTQAPAAAAAAAAPPAPAANNIEFDQENDLLGTLHIIVELFVLCSIIYFYSTFNRFIIVFVIFALLYL
jgi:flagellar biosynthesis protein FliP